MTGLEALTVNSTHFSSGIKRETWTERQEGRKGIGSERGRPQRNNPKDGRTVRKANVWYLKL